MSICPAEVLYPDGYKFTILNDHVLDNLFHVSYFASR